MAGGQEAARLYVSVGADLSELERGLGKAKAELDRFGAAAGATSPHIKRVEEASTRAAGAFESMAGSAARSALYGASFGLAFAAVNTVTSAIGGLISSGIAMNAQLETSRIQFQNLGLSGEAAKSHIAELFKLGAETPFETQPLIDASRMLRVFGGDALDTMSNLRLFGDTSAATGADLGALTFWVGRLYADLQQGKPIGEAEQNLRQLAVLSPQAATAMDRLVAAHRPASEIFSVFTGSLQRFNGAMETQAGTMQGLTSTFSDLSQQIAATALEPAFEAIKANLASINTSLQSDAVKTWAESFAGGLRNLGTTWDALPGGLLAFLTGNAGGHGAAQFGTGIDQAFAAGTVSGSSGNEFAERRTLAARLAGLGTAGDMGLSSSAVRDLGNVIPPWLDVALSPGGIASLGGFGMEQPGLLAKRPASFFGMSADRLAFGYSGTNLKESLSRRGDELAQAALEGQALAAGAGDDLFSRHGAAALQEALAPTSAQTLASQAAMFAHGQAVAQAGLAAGGVADQLAAFGRTREQTELGRQMRGLQAAGALDVAFGNPEQGRSEEMRAAKLQDHLRYLQEVSANEQQLAAVRQQTAAAQLEQDRAIQAGDLDSAKAIGDKVASFKAWEDQIKAAGHAIEETTDAQNALNVKTLELQFSRGQAAARAGLSDDALAWRIGTLGHPETGRLQAAKDQKELEDQLFGVFQERRSAELDLQRAQRDGDEAGAVEIERRLKLYDLEIAKIKELAGGKARGSPSWWKSLSKEEQDWRKQVGDVYGLYGGGGTALDPNAAEKVAKEAAKSQDTHLHGDVNITVQNATSDEVLGALDTALKRLRRQPPVLAPA